MVKDPVHFRPDQIITNTLKNRHPQLSDGQLEKLKSLIQELADKVSDDFKPNENFFSHEDLSHITQRASSLMVESTNSLESAELLKGWNLAVVDFHRSRFWGFVPQVKKPKIPLSEDQKIRKELFSYIWVFFQSMIVLKTAVYFFGLEYADKKEPINLFFLLAAISTSFCSLIFFAYRKNKKSISEEPK